MLKTLPVIAGLMLTTCTATAPLHAEPIRIYSEAPVARAMEDGPEYIDVDLDVPHVADVIYHNNLVYSPGPDGLKTYSFEVDGYEFQAVITSRGSSVPESFEVITPPNFYSVPEVHMEVEEGETVVVEIYHLGMM